MILVTGAAGFIGSHVVERLLEQGRPVLGLDNFHPYYPEALKHDNLAHVADHPMFRLVAGDIRDRAVVDEVLACGVTAVLHLAGLAGVRPSVENPMPYMDVNVGGTAMLFDRAVHHKVQRFVLTSSSSVYGNTARPPFVEDEPCCDPVSPYGASKRGAELVAQSYTQLCDMRISVLRLFTVYGPRQRPEMAIHRFVRLIERGEPIPVYGDGSTARDYTYVTDIAEGICAALELDGHIQTLNLGGAHPVRLSEMIAKVGRACGREPQVKRLPDQPGDVLSTSADITRASRLLGFSPRVGLDEGLERFVAWYRERGAARDGILLDSR